MNEHAGVAIRPGDVTYSRGYRCSLCHKSVVDDAGQISNQAKHANMVVDWQFDTLDSRVSASSAYGSASGTASPSDGNTRAYASCSKVYCHSNVQPNGGVGEPDRYATPTWGNGIGCTGCHSIGWDGYTFSVHSEDISSGSHTRHMAYEFGVSSDVLRCMVCHNYTGTTAPDCNGCHFNTNEKEHHVDGNVDVKFYSAFVNGSATYNGTPKPGDGYSSCANTYCHGNYPGSGKNATPTWDNASSATCGSCHGASSAAVPLSGSHSRHADGSGTYGHDRKYACTICHNGIISGSDPAYSIADKTKHINRMVDWRFDSTYSLIKPNSSYTYSAQYSIASGVMSASDGTTRAYGTCTVYCHSDAQGADGNGKGGPTSYSSFTWGGKSSFTGKFACGSCHKAGGISHDTSNNMISSGSHTQHYKGYYSCSICHFGITSGGGCGVNCHSSLGENRHVNGLVEVSFSSFTNPATAFYNKNPASWSTDSKGYLPGSGYASCSNVSCHNDGTSVSTGVLVSIKTATWGAVGQCGSCHGNPPAYGNGNPKANSHEEHAIYDCSKCHYTDYSNRCNNTKYDVAASYTFSTAGGTCSTIYCHQGGLGPASYPTVTWGSTLTCTSCHGTTATYTNYRAAAPQYASSYSKGNAHAYHLDVTDTSPTGTSGSIQCKHCHNATTIDNITIANRVNHGDGLYTVGGGTSTFRKWSDGLGSEQSVTMTYVYTYSPGTCSNVSCHPPTATTVTWQDISQDTYYSSCLSCHGITLNVNTGYHHSINLGDYAVHEYDTPIYPTAIPEGNASSGTNYGSRKCKMCHVDHNIFSPKINPSNAVGRSMNLRTDISAVPNSTSGYTNSDFDNALPNGGICTSCHVKELAKDTSLRKDEDYYLKSTMTPTVTKTAYNSSAHNYAVTSTMTSGGTFNANCSKCHNAGNNETVSFQTSTYKFKTHDSTFRRLLSPLGMTAPSDLLEENFCFRCHSRTTDTDPGGGPAKSVSEKDYFGVSDMSAAAEDIFSEFNRSFSKNILYFNAIAQEGPSEPMPNDHQTGDTFSGGDWIGRSMSPFASLATSPVAAEIKSQTTLNVNSNPVYWKMATFTSPPVTAATIIPPGQWSFQVYCWASDANMHAKVRYKIYKWPSTDTGTATTIVPVVESPVEMGLTVAPILVQNQVTSSVSLAPGDKISVDIELVTSATDTASHTAYLTYGRSYWGMVAFPAVVPFAPLKGGHTVAAYNAKHRPLPADERFSYLGSAFPFGLRANKHVECGDCHNVHEAGTITHLTGTNAVSPVLKGVSGAVVNYAPSAVNTLYFRETEPSEPAPNKSGNTIDTFMGGMWDRKEMLPTQVQGSLPNMSYTVVPTIPGYWLMSSYVSPPVAQTTVVSAGTWAVSQWAYSFYNYTESYIRAYLYVWRQSDTIGTVICGPVSNTTPISTSAYTENISNCAGSAFTLYPGDRIVAELSIDARSNNRAYIYFDRNNPDTRVNKVVMPSYIPFVSYVSGTAAKEYEICFRCHSGVNGSVIWGPLEGPSAWTDPGIEFNPENKSAHPVVRTLNEQLVSPLSSDRLLPPWNVNAGNQTMYCSDCHAADSASSSGGAHNSGIKWMLAGTNKSWPYQGTGSNGIGGGTYWTLGTSATNAGTANGLFCLNCHPVTNTNDTHKNPANAAIACVSCHIRVPHGGKVPRLINTNTPGRVPRYSPDGNGNGAVYLNIYNGETW